MTRRLSNSPSIILGILREAALRKAEVSGENICRGLGVSRVAVWKHIQTLRRHGYKIEAHTRRGYRLHLAPDCPSELEMTPRLQGRRLGLPFRYAAEADSTNRLLTAWAEEGAPEGAMIAADTQTGGRGRRGRKWFSPPGCNLYVSVLLRPAVPPPQVPSLALAAGLAVIRALRRVTPTLDPKLKWPNDLYLDGRKLGGILCDMRAESDHVHHVIVGIGLNVNLKKSVLPAELRETATSLRLAGRLKINRPALLVAILEELEGVYQPWCQSGLTHFLDELRACSWLQDKPVVAVLPHETLEGVVTGIAASGALLLKTASGPREIHAGDIRLV